MSTSTEIPKVTGRHRNRALAAERRRRAVEMALGGATYQQIAQGMGYANRGTVHRIVQQALRQREVESIDEMRQLELDRLDALQAAQWEVALEGDVHAAAVILKVMDRRCRPLGLYASYRPRQGVHGPSPFLVDPAELVACGGWPVRQGQGHPRPGRWSADGVP